jgi:hypothetical protein
VIICLGPPLPAASSGSLKRDGEVGQPLSLGLAPGRGLPSRHLSMPLVRSYRTLAPLPDPPLRQAETGPSAVCFCGTVLTVTRTGRYPAGLAVREPGLSSTGPAAWPKATRAPIAITSPAFPLNVRGWSGVQRAGGCLRPMQGPSRAGRMAGARPTIVRPSRRHLPCGGDHGGL